MTKTPTKTPKAQAGATDEAQANIQAQAQAQAQQAGNQALLDAVIEQRNAAMNQLAQTGASLRIALGEVERLSAELAKARKTEAANAE